MSTYSELLNFDLENLMTLSDVYFGYAESLIKTEDRRHYPYIASCYCISAIFKSIIKPGSGTESFQRAADYYKREGNSCWVVCSACAYDIDKVSQFVNQNEQKGELKNEVLENILASAIIEKSIDRESNFQNSLVPVGRLNIPIKIYVDAIEDVSKIKMTRYNDSFSFDNISSFLKRSSESIYLLKEDSFHWQNLYGNFIPLEPEILGFCIAICKKLKKMNVTVSQVFERTDITTIAKLPLRIANDITNLYYSNF